ncbi:MAG: DUF1254 domain-containing protein [Nitrospirota bacterium]|nr:DUF1254 domain-containing protein [Nitrospirota bacterium]MDH5773408.1 DUF1254 domain-containing protein [Nitrospirota bacterium]
MNRTIACLIAIGLSLMVRPAFAEGPQIKFEAGYPAQSTIQGLYDELDYQRAVQAYIWATPAVAGASFIKGAKRDLGASLNNIVIWESSANPQTVVFTGNSQSIYSIGIVDLEKYGPVVAELPPAVLGMVNNVWYYPLADVGIAGPDQGKGGKYLILPPNYQGEVPEGYYVVKSDTYDVIWLVRGFLKDGKPDAAISDLKKIKVYPLKEKDNPPPTTSVNASVNPSDLTFPTGYDFFKILAGVIQKEPTREQDKVMLGMLSSLGIEKGKPFNPDKRIIGILQRAAETGNAMARAIAYNSRNPKKNPYPDRQWEWIFLTDKPTFETETFTDLEARVTYLHQACFTANAMVMKSVGKGSQYLAAYKDKDGKWLDGANTYKLHLPANVPVKDFWSLMMYDSETRSMVVTDQGKAGVDSYGQPKKNTDGSIDLYIGPTAPKGYESNWVKTIPGKGVFAYLRWYGPTEAFFDKSWKPSDFELVK